jgi:hypothetical protein
MTHTRRARASGCPEYVTVRLAFAGHEGHGRTGRSAKPGWPKNVCRLRLIGAAAFLAGGRRRMDYACRPLPAFMRGCGRFRPGLWPPAGPAQRLRCARGPGDYVLGPGSCRAGASTSGGCLMSVPGTESAPAAENAAVTAAAGSGVAVLRDDPRLPWHGKPRAADILCSLGIVISGLSYRD